MNACTDSRPLIMSYLDGELSEAQAAPLRKHLLECQPCRASAQDQKNLTRWLSIAKEVEAPVHVPRDFAARVARRAFQGDRGALTVEAPMAVLPHRRDERSFRFVLALTAAAAAIVLFFAVAIRQMTLPTSSRMMAADENVLPLDKTIQELDRLNALDCEPTKPANPAETGRRP